MTPWQTGTALFFGYVAVVAVLPRGLDRRRQVLTLAGAAVGAGLLTISILLPGDGFANRWLLPPALLLLGYRTSGLLFVAPMPRVERALAALDHTLAIQTTAARCPRPLVELLEFAYAAVYPLVPVAAFIAFRSGVSADRFWTTVLVTDYICFAMLPWIQTRPPRSLGFDIPWKSTFRPLNERLLDAGSVKVNTFPSGHAAEGLALALLVLDAPAPLVIWMFLNGAAISAGAVLGRYHYAADAFAGWLVALLVWGVNTMKKFAIVAAVFLLWPPPAPSAVEGLTAQQRPTTPPRTAAAPAQEDSIRPASNRGSESKGPFKTLVVRNAMLIDGTGAAARGPVDIVVEGNRIAAVRSAGTPGLPLRPNRAPQNAEHEIDATGMYVMPGFVDLHVHAGGAPKNVEAEYAYKLWLAHGVTTVRGVPLAGHSFSVSEKARSAKNEIAAPRIFNYQRPGAGWDRGQVDTPEKAREWVRWAKANGIDGLKVGAQQPDIMAALMSEAKANGLGSTAHLDQGGVAQMNAIKAARLGLGTVTHFYGHFESLLKDYVVQPYPVGHNMNDEYMRFGQVARLWDKIHEPGSPEWKAYLAEHLKLGTTFDPTMTIYSAGRDVMRFRAAEWHDKYTLPSLMDFYTPSRAAHGSYWFDWTTEDEVAWRNFYQVWFKLLNDYKKMGGRVATGSDSGFIYQTYGFGYVNELEMLQEAGFHPLEVMQSATMNGALTLHEPQGKPLEFGIVRAGLLADMVIVDQNPLQNFKVLYGSGAVRLNDKTGKPEPVGGVKYTIKDGVVYDAKQLLAEVAAMVEKQKKERAGKTTTQAAR